MKVDQTKASEGAPQGASPEREPEREGEAQEESLKRRTRRRQTVAMGLLIFAVAFGVRLLLWHDTRREVWAVQTVVAEDYRRVARILREGGLNAFLSRESPLSDPNNLGHPPGYSILLALLFSALNESDALVQFFQIACDAAAAVLIFFIVAGLLSRSAAFVTGLLVALSPQFAWNSVLMLPDSLSVLPVLLAVYFLSSAYRRPHLLKMVAAGALIGVSCWLRANAMLLAPFMTLAVPFLFKRGMRLRYCAALLGGTILIVAPLTLRNALVYGHFIPVSLGAGQTLLEGISDYDSEKRFGIPDTDIGIMKWEAEMYNRPDYYGTLFNPDGVKRERMRLAHGLKVIGSHPIWFAGVMARRGASMLKLERVRLISKEPPVTYSLELTQDAAPVWSNTPGDLLATGTIVFTQEAASVGLMTDEAALYLTGDDSKYGDQLISAPITIKGNTDYLITIPVRTKQGRMFIKVESAQRGSLYADAIVETIEGKTSDEQPVKIIQLPFVSGSSADQIRIHFANGASKPAPPSIEIGPVRLYELGPASYVWTRYPRLILRGIQKLFLTAVMLPLAIIGILLLLRAGKSRALIILLVVPAYFLCVQSATHTEYRYVLAVHYFLFSMSAVSLVWLGGASWQLIQRARSRP
jgi:hypothetical protein